MAIFLLGCLILTCMMNFDVTGPASVQSHGSQVPWRSRDASDKIPEEATVDLRVARAITSRVGAPTGAKPTDHGNGTANFSWSAKRAYRRARQRAAVNGGTFYRGRWHTVSTLGAQRLSPTGQNMQNGTVDATVSSRSASRNRIRVLTYNIGGMSGEAYPVFCDWLVRQREAEIVLVQELHWGCGQSEGTWLIGKWQAIVSADPGNRYCGVGIFISPKLQADVGFCSWIPGRLLHVRCETPQVTVDVVCLYQWAVDERQPAVNESRRQQVWQQLGRLLQGLPRRHLLVLGADANASCRHLAGCVGRGILDPTSRNVSEDFMQILQVNQLVLLNTWGLSRGSASHTFHNGSHRTQIDFLATRRPAADQESRRASAIALDLTPWRFGPKHRPVVGSLPWRAGWTFSKPPTP